MSSAVVPDALRAEIREQRCSCSSLRTPTLMRGTTPVRTDNPQGGDNQLHRWLLRKMKRDQLLNIGSCRWKYDSWVGLIYSNKKKKNYLKGYLKVYSTVEIDQWLWSLFPDSKEKLPEARVVADYASSVQGNFKFSIKVPNSITLTHYYFCDKMRLLEKNPYFLLPKIFEEILETLLPMQG